MKKVLFSLLVIIFYSHSAHWNGHEAREVSAKKEISNGYLLGFENGLNGLQIHQKGYKVQAIRVQEAIRGNRDGLALLKKDPDFAKKIVEKEGDFALTLQTYIETGFLAIKAVKC